MQSRELSVSGEGLPLTLVTTIQIWADSRTDLTTSRRKDLIHDKTSAVADF